MDASEDLMDKTGQSNLDLKREAAYNLSHLYTASGNVGLARQILHTYCSI